MTAITLTTDQQNASNAFCRYICEPDESVFVIEGYSGTGKSTLVKHLLDELPVLLKTIKAINPAFYNYEVLLTATTNKAAESLSYLSKMPVRTIHSVLGIRPYKDLSTGKTTLIRVMKEFVEDSIIFIDEASYIDSELLTLIFQSVRNCKIIFMGDPAQLVSFTSGTAPVFNAGFTTAKLTNVVRNSGPILEVSTIFREWVTTGDFKPFKPDGTIIRHLPRRDFNNELLASVKQSGWTSNTSKYLAWTNKSTISYNRGLTNELSGQPDFQAGDYAINNSYIAIGGGKGIKTDEDVYISQIRDFTDQGLDGKQIQINGSAWVFMPNSLVEKKKLIKTYQANNNYHGLTYIDRNWIDLRAAFGSTVNKAQGSTYKEVFIDLDDIAGCNQTNQVARMLYVATSRATDRVTYTGDLV